MASFDFSVLRKFIIYSVGFLFIFILLYVILLSARKQINILCLQASPFGLSSTFLFVIMTSSLQNGPICLTQVFPTKQCVYTDIPTQWHNPSYHTPWWLNSEEERDYCSHKQIKKERRQRDKSLLKEQTPKGSVWSWSSLCLWQRPPSVSSPALLPSHLRTRHHAHSVTRVTARRETLTTHAGEEGKTSPFSQSVSSLDLDEHREFYLFEQTLICAYINQNVK